MLVLDGAHSIYVSAKVTQDVISAVYRELIVQNVLLEGTLLKPNMVLAGKECPTQPSVDEIAHLTVRVLQNSVPPAVPGIVFLSGGMSEVEASGEWDCRYVDPRVSWHLCSGTQRNQSCSRPQALEAHV